MLAESPSLNNPGWDQPAVAAAQRALVERELEQDPQSIPPYAAFLRAMATIRPAMRASLLDLGCGVGHYASLLRRHWPTHGFHYVGIDNSAPMIAEAQAREPDCVFVQRGIAECDMRGFDIVLHSVAAECSPQALSLVCCILERAQNWVIWNRIRLGPQSGYIEEPTYAGYGGPIWIWHRLDLVGLLNQTGRRYLLQAWPGRDDSITAIIYPCRPDKSDD